MPSELVQKTADYVKLKLYNEPTGRDWYHVERVWKTAAMLQEKEGGDLELIGMSALLHDLGDYKQYDFNERKGSFVLLGMMDILGVEEEMEKKIIKIVNEAQFNGVDTKTPSSLEGKIIQDADWLDALGAIGISRIFATGGGIGRIIYDPAKKPRLRLSKQDYQQRKQEGTSINFFYEKCFKLPKLMNTKTARAIAEKRVELMEDFIKEFFAECKGER